MYYTRGNYEAFARPRKPERADRIGHVWLVGGGIASLAAAAFLIRDAQVPGDHITILEALPVEGGALDGAGNAQDGWLIRGGREVDNHYECLWDLYRSIPSLEVEGASVLDEFYWLNKDDPNYSLMRATRDRGQDGGTDNRFNLSAKGQRELARLLLTREEDLFGKTIEQVLSDEVLGSNFWLYWRTMFAFENWHSALEMKRYVARFINHIGGMPDFTALRFFKYNQYESMVLPLVSWLRQQGVTVQHDSRVTNVEFSFAGERKQATRIEVRHEDGEGAGVDGIDVGPDDLVFITNGSLVENSSWGDHHTPARFDPEIREGNSWDLWRRIAAQHEQFGHPDVFCGDPEKSQWESATVTTLDARIPEYIQRIAQRDPSSGRVVTGGIVTVRDSSWLLSWTVNRQPHFREQPHDQVTVWLYSLFTDVPGDYVKKPMRECTGEEITKEWLYHLGVPIDQIDELAASGAICRPCMMPFVTAFFMPRTDVDRPLVVPEGSVNFAFLGQFAEVERDCIFTIEYSVRTAMEAVYQLLDIERGIPEVYGSVYDVRTLMDAAATLRDHAPISLPRRLQRLAERTEIGRLLVEHGLLPADPTRQVSRAVAAHHPVNAD